MGYPLGQFPRYGHQIQRAAERRERAIWNSIVTRRNRANYYLRVEAAFYNNLIQFTNSAKAKTPEGQLFLDNLNARLYRIKTKLEQGHRVYFRKLGCILRDFVVEAGMCNEIHNFSEQELAELAKNIGIEQLAQQS